MSPSNTALAQGGGTANQFAVIQIGRYLSDPTTLSLGVVSANTQLKTYTKYRLWSSVDGFFKFGSDNSVAATTSSNPLTAKIDTLHATDGDNFWIAGIVSGGTGVLFISEVTVP